jgi:isoleucyl-tRNA synthetase
MLGRFIDTELSNWYIRRNRARFWKSTDADDKAAAYQTLFCALETIAFLLGPVAPMSADALYLALHPDGGGLDSVHLGDLPESDLSLIDEKLERQMAAILDVVRLGRAAREKAKIGVRRPLPRLVASGPDREALDGLLDDALGREVREELNVKELVVAERSGAYCTVTVKPNLPILGPRYGKQLGKIRSLLAALDDAQIALFETGGEVTLDIDGEAITLQDDDLLVERSGREGYAVAAEGGYMAALDTQITDGLRLEGYAREIINRVQNVRKKSGFEITQRIQLGIWGSPAVVTAAAAHEQRIASEVLASEVTISDAAASGETFVIDDLEVVIAIEPA